MVGKTISHYKIIEKLPISPGQVGRGEMGIVYLTDDFKLNRKSAKIYYFFFKTDHSEICRPEQVKKFRLEKQTV